MKDGGKEGGVRSSMMDVQWVMIWLDSINEGGAKVDEGWLRRLK